MQSASAWPVHYVTLYWFWGRKQHVRNPSRADATIHKDWDDWEGQCQPGIALLAVTYSGAAALVYSGTAECGHGSWNSDLLQQQADKKGASLQGWVTGGREGREGRMDGRMEGWRDNCPLCCSREELKHKDTRLVTQVSLAVRSRYCSTAGLCFENTRVTPLRHKSHIRQSKQASPPEEPLTLWIQPLRDLLGSSFSLSTYRFKEQLTHVSRSVKFDDRAKSAMVLDKSSCCWATLPPGGSTKGLQNSIICTKSKTCCKSMLPFWIQAQLEEVKERSFHQDIKTNWTGFNWSEWRTNSWMPYWNSSLMARQQTEPVETLSETFKQRKSVRCTQAFTTHSDEPRKVWNTS